MTLSAIASSDQFVSSLNASIIRNMFDFSGEEVKAGVKIIALGGQNDTGGKNCYAIVTPNGEVILIDCGRIIHVDEYPENLPSEFNRDRRFRSPYPDFSLIDQRRLVAVLLSHGHLDHILGLPELLRQREEVENPPALKIFGAPMALKLAKRYLRKNGFSDHRLSDLQVSFFTLQDSQWIGEFQVDSYPVHHSIPDSRCFVIKVSGVKILYLTDFKYTMHSALDRKDFSELLASIGAEGIDLMMIDSTNAQIDGYTESVLLTLTEFDHILRENPEKRIFVPIFSSEIETIAMMIEIIKKYRRPIECDGTQMRYFFQEFELLDNCTFDPSLPPVIFLTGCQGEENSAMVNIANGTGNYSLGYHNDRYVDDLIVFATNTIPTRVNRCAVNELLLTLAHYKYCTVIPPNNGLHVSGHECADGLANAVCDIFPRKYVAIHGMPESRRALCAAVARTLNVIKASYRAKIDDDWLPKPLVLDERRTLII